MAKLPMMKTKTARYNKLMIWI